MQLIPAIDLRNGRVVRLLQGDDSQRREYGADPCATARHLAESGARRIHVVDLDAAFGEPSQRPLLARMIAAAGCAVQVGGGLRDREAIEWALAAGSDRVVVTSLIERDFVTFSQLCEENPGRVVAALDVRGGALRVAGWRETATTSLDEVCERLRALPLACVLVTDIERDGVLGGPNFELACTLARRSGTKAILSGGVASLDDLRRAATFPEIEAAVVGRAIYDGRIELDQAFTLLRDLSVGSLAAGNRAVGVKR